MGRKSTPASVHLVNGNPSKLSIDDLKNALAPRVPFEIPECPRFLTPVAKAEYDRIAPLLVASGLLTKLDSAVLAAYAQSWGEWVTTDTEIKRRQKTQKTDALIDVTPSGYKQIAALVQVRDRAIDRCIRFAKEFGLTPASRIQSTTGQQMALPGVPDDPMESFLNAGAGLPPAPVH